MRAVDLVRPEIVPPLAVMLVARKSVGAWLNVKCTVAVLSTTLTLALSTATATVGVRSVDHEDALLAPGAGDCRRSCQSLSTVTERSGDVGAGIGGEGGGVVRAVRPW